jgi:hypothetical protein
VSNTPRRTPCLLCGREYISTRDDVKSCLPANFEGGISRMPLSRGATAAPLQHRRRKRCAERSLTWPHLGNTSLGSRATEPSSTTTITPHRSHRHPPSSSSFTSTIIVVHHYHHRHPPPPLSSSAFFVLRHCLGGSNVFFVLASCDLVLSLRRRSASAVARKPSKRSTRAKLLWSMYVHHPLCYTPRPPILPSHNVAHLHAGSPSSRNVCRLYRS